MVDALPQSQEDHEALKVESISAVQNRTSHDPRIKAEPSAIVAPDEEYQTPRPQNLPLAAKVRNHKPPPQHVIVLAFGSFGIRYGFASDSTPKRLYPAVAFPRDAKAVKEPSTPAICVPTSSPRDEADVETARANFDDICETITNDLALNERRRGGGKPIPWKVEIEPVLDDHWENDKWANDQNSWAFDQNKIIVGRDVLKLLRSPERAARYDIVFPVWDGQLTFDCGAPSSLIRKSISVLLDHIVEQLEQSRKEAKPKVKAGDGSKDDRLLQRHEDFVRDNIGCATSFVSLVVPETAQRRDIAEFVDAIFRSRSLRCAAVFVHQSAVSCALGAGLATCAVVDIGHSATVIACVEDGIICGESRIHLQYGSYHVQRAFEHLIREYSDFHKVLVEDYKYAVETSMPIILDEEIWLINKICEQAGGFNVDENDSLNVTLVTAPSGRSVRAKLGVGLRAVPVYGLIYPSLLKAALESEPTKMNFVQRGTFEKNSEDDNFVGDIFNDLRRSTIATAALPIGIFANDPRQPAEQTVNAESSSIVDAIIWSIAKAIEAKRPDQQSRTPDHYRRYLNAIVLAGGGAKIEGIASALEGRIKKGFQDAGLNISDVTVIDGGKGKGDEELVAAAAVLKDVDSDGGLLDDTDTASLPWKGGAVMVEADAVNDYWVYRDDWDSRNVRALRERAPFYW